MSRMKECQSGFIPEFKVLLCDMCVCVHNNANLRSHDFSLESGKETVRPTGEEMIKGHLHGIKKHFAQHICAE